MINRIWFFMILIGFSFMFINGKIDMLNESILSSGKMTLDIIIQIFPLVSLWLGIMNIADKSFLLKKISKIMQPFLLKIFPDIPKGHESLGYISSNIVANILGLGNAATPLGIKAMESLQKINKNKSVASRSMITFLVINTCGFTIVPMTIISLRMAYHSKNPSIVIFPCIVVSFVSLIFGLIIDRWWANK